MSAPLRIRRLTPLARLPAYATPGASGLDKRPGQWTRQDELRVGAILRRAGYARKRVRRPGELVYGWVKEGSK